MPKGSYGLSPNQQENQRKSFEAILAEADAIPAPVIPPLRRRYAAAH